MRFAAAGGFYQPVEEAMTESAGCDSRRLARAERRWRPAGRRSGSGGCPIDGAEQRWGAGAAVGGDEERRGRWEGGRAGSGTGSGGGSGITDGKGKQQQQPRQQRRGSGSGD
ncbi:hypothetical protein Syun_025404 [Stephania yunnanensis]|uniref:Uncharacterized protein n=1 Tax=Stephania yunnanensis TaxID=152371 RepID=A0AAP0ES40_9MAGN